MNMKEATRFVSLLEADGWESEKIVRAIKYVENGLEETPSKEEILSYLERKEDK